MKWLESTTPRIKLAPYHLPFELASIPLHENTFYEFNTYSILYLSVYDGIQIDNGERIHTFFTPFLSNFTYNC